MACELEKAWNKSFIEDFMVVSLHSFPTGITETKKTVSINILQAKI
jgi:hypothetical protein